MRKLILVVLLLLPMFASAQETKVNYYPSETPECALDGTALCSDLEFMCVGGAQCYAPWFNAPISSGTVAMITTGVSNRPGVQAFSAAAGAGSGYCVRQNNGIVLIGGESFKFWFSPKLNTNTVLYAGFFGVGSCSASTPAQGVWLNNASGTLTGKAADFATVGTTTTGSSYSLTLDTWYYAEITISRGASPIVTYSLYASPGARLWSDTLAFPAQTGATAIVGSGFSVADTVGGVASLVEVDRMAIRFTGLQR